VPTAAMHGVCPLLIFHCGRCWRTSPLRDELGARHLSPSSCVAKRGLRVSVVLAVVARCAAALLALLPALLWRCHSKERKGNQQTACDHQSIEQGH
jgi:hypothetical protein